MAWRKWAQGRNNPEAGQVYFNLLPLLEDRRIPDTFTYKVINCMNTRAHAHTVTRRQTCICFTNYSLLSVLDHKTLPHFHFNEQFILKRKVLQETIIGDSICLS